MLEILDRARASYELIPHAHTETALDEARELGFAPTEVAKTIVVETRTGHVARPILPAARAARPAQARRPRSTSREAAPPDRGRPGAGLPGVRARQRRRRSAATRTRSSSTPASSGTTQVVLEAGSHAESMRLRTADLISVAGATVADIGFELEPASARPAPGQGPGLRPGALRRAPASRISQRLITARGACPALVRNARLPLASRATPAGNQIVTDVHRATPAAAAVRHGGGMAKRTLIAAVVAVLGATTLAACGGGSNSSIVHVHAAARSCAAVVPAAARSSAPAPRSSIRSSRSGSRTTTKTRRRHRHLRADRLRRRHRRDHGPHRRLRRLRRAAHARPDELVQQAASRSPGRSPAPRSPTTSRARPST